MARNPNLVRPFNQVASDWIVFLVKTISLVAILVATIPLLFGIVLFLWPSKNGSWFDVLNPEFPILRLEYYPFSSAILLGITGFAEFFYLKMLASLLC